MFINENHWALLFVSMTENTIYYINPSGTNKHTLNEVAENFSKFAASSKHFKHIRFNGQYIKHQIQKDDHNCGVYVCHFFEMLVTKRKERFTQEINISSYRADIKSRIIGASKITVCCVCSCEKSPEEINNKRPEKNKLIKIVSKISKNIQNPLIKFNCGHMFHKKCLPTKKPYVFLK